MFVFEFVMEQTFNHSTIGSVSAENDSWKVRACLKSGDHPPDPENVRPISIGVYTVNFQSPPVENLDPAGSLLVETRRLRRDSGSAPDGSCGRRDAGRRSLSTWGGQDVLVSDLEVRSRGLAVAHKKSRTLCTTS